MNRVPQEEKKMTAHEKEIIEILDSTKKLTTNNALVASIFQSAGIFVDDGLSLVLLTGNAETCVNSLMGKLSAMPVIKILAKRILWNRGLRGGQSVYFLCSAPPQRRTSWLTRKAG